MQNMSVCLKNQYSYFNTSSTPENVVSHGFSQLSLPSVKHNNDHKNPTLSILSVVRMKT